MGEFSSNKIDGFVISTDFVSCETKQGYMAQDNFEDFGQIENFEKSFFYFGKFEDDHFDGPGELLLANRYYLGDFKTGEKSGLGLEISESGLVYVGHFFENQKNGFGIEKFVGATFGVSKDDTYAGEFEGNSRTGRCCIFYSISGACYIGMVDEGMYHGFGKLETYLKISVGEFHSGELSGLAYENHLTGKSYFGQFRKG